MLALILIPAMAALNRLSGIDRWAPGRNIYWTSIATGLLAGLIAGAPFGLTCFAAMLCYRLPGWYGLIDIGRDEGKAHIEFVLMALRSMTVGVPFILTQPSFDTVIATISVGLLCAMSYAAAWQTELPRKLKDPNAFAEIAAGAFIGLYFADRVWSA